MNGKKNSNSGTGTTLCPHCGTRFRVAWTQLEAHHGLVRCGHCLQTFDTRPNFAPEEIDPQLELPILDEIEAQAEAHLAEQPSVEEPGATATPGSAKAGVLQPLTLAGQVEHLEIDELDALVLDAVEHRGSHTQPSRQLVHVSTRSTGQGSRAAGATAGRGASA